MDEPTSSTIRQTLLYGGAHRKAGRDIAYVTNVYSLIALFAATIFGTLHFLNMFVDANTTVGAIELGVGAVVLLNMIGLRLHHNVALAKNILLAAILILLEVLLATGGTQNTGVFWLFAFPVATFFMAGKKQGMWWIVALFTLIIATAVGASMSLFTIPYSQREIYQLIISLSVVTLGVYIFQDARENALDEIMESRRDLQEYLDQMPTYSIKVGLDGRVLFANKTAKESSGLGERMLGTKFFEGQSWAPNEKARARTEAAFHDAVTGKTVNYDEQIRVVTGAMYNNIIVNFNLVPVFKDERIAYILVEARDVTAEREVTRTKNEFVSIATQQLRPSVLAIADAVEKLRNPSAALPDDLRETINHIRRNNQQINSVVNNMLLVSGLELGNLPVKLQKLNLADVSGSVVEAVRAVYLKDRKLEVSEDYGEHLPEVEVDFELFSTVLYDLVLNAIKFTPDDGQIHIRINQVEQKLTPESKGSIQIEVQDTGIGIPEDEQKLVFTKFFQAKNNKQQSGSGQSLYIIKKLLDYVGGTVTFMSKENVGTIFVVMLPLEGMDAHETSGK